MTTPPHKNRPGVVTYAGAILFLLIVAWAIHHAGFFR